MVEPFAGLHASAFFLCPLLPDRRQPDHCCAFAEERQLVSWRNRRVQYTRRYEAADAQATQYSVHYASVGAYQHHSAFQRCLNQTWA